MMAGLGLGFVGKSGFEYSATKVFEYSNTYEYLRIRDIMLYKKIKYPSAGVIDLTIN